MQAVQSSMLQGKKILQKKLQQLQNNTKRKWLVIYHFSYNFPDTGGVIKIKQKPMMRRVLSITTILSILIFSCTKKDVAADDNSNNNGGNNNGGGNNNAVVYNVNKA